MAENIQAFPGETDPANVGPGNLLLMTRAGPGWLRFDLHQSGNKHMSFIFGDERAMRDPGARVAAPQQATCMQTTEATIVGFSINLIYLNRATRDLFSWGAFDAIVAQAVIMRLFRRFQCQ